MREVGVGIGGCRAQLLGVRVLRTQDHVVGGTPLDDAPLVEHEDLVAEVARGGEVVRDVEHAEPLFALEVGTEVQKAIGRQELALNAIDEAGVDLLLAGHNHHASTHHASDLVTRSGGALVIQAGTATSTRVRGQDQSFNVIEAGQPDTTVVVHAWDGAQFVAADAQRYVLADGHWRIAKAADAAH